MVGPRNLRPAHTLAALLVLAGGLCSCNGSPGTTHARVMALDASTGHLRWLSHDLKDFALFSYRMSTNDGAHSLTVAGITCTSQTDSEDVSATVDARSGAIRKRGHGRWVSGTLPDYGQDATTDREILARRGSVDYELDRDAPRLQIIAVSHRQADSSGHAKFLPPQRPIWSREVPGPHRVDGVSALVACRCALSSRRHPRHLSRRWRQLTATPSAAGCAPPIGPQTSRLRPNMSGQTSAARALYRKPVRCSVSIRLRAP